MPPKRNIAEVGGSYLAQKGFFSEDPPIIIFDVGAHRGETIDAYRKIFSQAIIYSFEPVRESFKKLVERIQFDNRISAFWLAFSDKKEIRSFYLTPQTNQSSFFGIPSGARRFDVMTDTVDSFCEDRKIEHIDILKLDVQGAEPLVLRGAIKMLKEKRISLVYTEMTFISPIAYQNTPPAWDIGKILWNCGFELFSIYNLCRTTSNQITHFDAIFLGPSLCALRKQKEKVKKLK